MPAWAVTSVNSMGPEGREGFIVESGDGDADGDANGAEIGAGGTPAAAGAVPRSLDCFCWQPANANHAPSIRQQATWRRGIRDRQIILQTITALRFVSQRSRGVNPARSRSAWRMAPR